VSQVDVRELMEGIILSRERLRKPLNPLGKF
jgi:hypothetical protein